MIEELKGKKVKVGVALYGSSMPRALFTNTYEGVINNCSTLGGETFLILNDNIMINTKYVQIIELI